MSKRKAGSPRPFGPRDDEPNRLCEDGHSPTKQSSFLTILLFLLTISPLSASILSLDLCSDQLLAEFLEPEEFYAVSYLAHAPDLSSKQEILKNVPTHGGRLEDFISPNIKIAISMDKMDPFLKNYFKKKKVSAIILKTPSSLKELKEVWVKLGRLFGRPQKAKKLCDRLNSLQTRSKQKIYAFFGVQGISMGGHTLWSDVLDKLGHKNAFADRTGWFYLEFEDLLIHPLDQIIFLSPNMKEATHPFFKKLVDHTQTINLPTSATLCPCLKSIEQLHGCLP